MMWATPRSQPQPPSEPTGPDEVDVPEPVRVAEHGPVPDDEFCPAITSAHTSPWSCTDGEG